jgi:hypothetical protein
MQEPEQLFSTGQRWLALAACKPEPEFSRLFARGMHALRQSLRQAPHFERWLGWLAQLFELLRQRPAQPGLFEIIEQTCLEFAPRIEPLESELPLLLAHLREFRIPPEWPPEQQQQQLHLLEGFFHHFGQLHPVWNGELLCLRGELLMAYALLQVPPCPHHLQAAGHSFLQARNWQPTRVMTHACLGLNLLWQAASAQASAAMLYALAAAAFSQALKWPERELPALEIPEILVCTLVQQLELPQALTLFRQLAQAWVRYTAVAPRERQHWLSQAQQQRYLETLGLYHRALAVRLEQASLPQLELWLSVWQEIFEQPGVPLAWMSVWLQIIRCLLPCGSAEQQRTLVIELSAWCNDFPTWSEPELFPGQISALLASFCEDLEPERLAQLGGGLYLLFAELLMQNGLDEESYHLLWLDPLAGALHFAEPELRPVLLHQLENAWLALIACSPDEHLIIDQREVLLEVLIHADPLLYRLLLRMLYNLYAFLLSRHHCDFNLAGFAAYLQSLAGHRSQEEARELLLESCRIYAQACEIAEEDDTELMMARQSALRALAAHEPERAHELEAEADGLCRQLLERSFERS